MCEQDGVIIIRGGIDDRDGEYFFNLTTFVCTSY